jgi:hypothetical protein
MTEWMSSDRSQIDLLAIQIDRLHICEDVTGERSGRGAVQL